MVNRCEKCNAVGTQTQIISRACDGNILIRANGEESSGYLPSVPGLCDSDGLCINICVACGQLQGLDLGVLRNTFQ